MTYTAAGGVTYELNLIDTPGHVDFSYEVSRSLAACEGAILVVDAAQGVEAQTLANLYQAVEAGLTLVPVVNKIDLDAAQPDLVADEIVEVTGLPREKVLFASAKLGTGTREILDVMRFRDQTVAIVLDQFFWSARIGNDHRNARGLSFNDHVPERVGCARKNENVRGGISSRQFLAG